MRHGDLDALLYHACAVGDAGYAKLLIAQGANQHAQDYLEQTPLHCACFGGHANCVKVLLAAGADLTRTDRRGLTPRDITERYGGAWRRECAAALDAWRPVGWRTKPARGSRAPRAAPGAMQALP